MLRRVLLLVALSAVVAGCGEAPAPVNLTDRALQEWRSGKYDEAIATATEAIRLDPGSVEAHFYRGRAYHLRNAMGDARRAVADYSEAIRLAPDSPEAYYHRAVIYRELGKDDLAEADDTKARSLDEALQRVYRELPDITKIPDAPEPAPEVAKGDDATKEPKKSLGDELGEKLRAGAADYNAEKSESFSERFDRRAKELASQEAGAEPEFGGLRSRDDDALLRRDDLDTPSGVPGGGLPWSPAVPITPPSSVLGSRRTGQMPMQPQPIPSLRSPFGHREPAPTGYVEPALRNPFAAPQQPAGVGQSLGGQQQFGQAPRTSVPTTRPPSSPYKYSNPLVRPANPRDYVK